MFHETVSVVKFASGGDPKIISKTLKHSNIPRYYPKASCRIATIVFFISSMMFWADMVCASKPRSDSPSLVSLADFSGGRT
jgi:hypothetical protein